MSDLISRADAIEAVVSWTVEDRPHEVMPTDLVDRIKALPSADAEFADMPDIPRYYYEKVVGKMAHEINMLKEQLESADAEQTDKLENQPRLVERNYTTEGGGGEIYHPTRQQGEWIWRTDIPIGDGRTSAGYICSNCGKDYWFGNVFKYCPSCGAIMKGGDDE